MITLEALILLAAVVAVLLGYDLAFVGVTRSVAKSISTTGRWRELQDALTPPKAGRFGCVVQVLALSLPLLAWCFHGWKTAALIFGGILLLVVATTAIFGSIGSGHYRSRILRSLMNRYADYRRDGDTLRANATNDLLGRLGFSATELTEEGAEAVPKLENESPGTAGGVLPFARKTGTDAPRPREHYVELEARFSPLISRYSHFLEEIARFYLGVPASAWGLTREETQNGLYLYTLALEELGELDEKMWDALKRGYMQTALLLSEAEGKDALAAAAAYDSGDPERIATAEVTRALKRQEEVLKEKARLGREFDLNFPPRVEE